MTLRGARALLGSCDFTSTRKGAWGSAPPNRGAAAFCASLSKRRDAEMQQVAIGDEALDGAGGNGKYAADGAAVDGRRIARHGAKQGAEGSQAFVARGEADFGDGHLITRQQGL